MNSLHFCGRSFRISNTGSCNYLVCIPGPRPDSLGRALIGLSHNDLRGIAQRKYGSEICRASYPASATLWRFLEMARVQPHEKPAAIPIPAEWEEKHRALDETRSQRWLSPRTPRRIPHVRMVRAAALQPGMRVPLIREDGRYVGETVVIGVAPCGWGVNVTTKWLPYRPGMTRQQQQDQYANMPPKCLQYAADHVFPVLIEWCDKVAL